LNYSEGDAIKAHVNNRYTLVVLAAKRALQLKEGAPALIETTSANFLTIALQEIAAGKVTCVEAVDVEGDEIVGQPDTALTASVKSTHLSVPEDEQDDLSSGQGQDLSVEPSPSSSDEDDQ
jgi:DNA-directed RNA polymerase subunit omega